MHRIDYPDMLEPTWTVTSTSTEYECPSCKKPPKCPDCGKKMEPVEHTYKMPYPWPKQPQWSWTC